MQARIIMANPTPLNKGDTLNRAIGPKLENCPIPHSSKNNGNPIITIIIEYATMNAPISKYVYHL